MDQDKINLPGRSITEITTQHKKMFEAVNGSLIAMILKQIFAGYNGSDLVGLVVEADDPILCEYIKPEGGVFLEAPRIEYAGTLKLYFGVTQRKTISYLIDLFPSFKERLSKLPGIGFTYVLVLGAGMASPYTLYWGQDLVLDWK